MKVLGTCNHEGQNKSKSQEARVIARNALTKDNERGTRIKRQISSIRMFLGQIHKKASLLYKTLRRVPNKKTFWWTEKAEN